MTILNRRRLLQTSALLGAAGALSACGSSGESTGSNRDDLTWWDHQGNQKKLHQKIFKKFATESGGLTVQYTFRNASKMGQALQLAVVAEGVETEAQYAILSELGCQRMQGWLLGRAMPLEEVVAQYVNVPVEPSPPVVSLPQNVGPDLLPAAPAHQNAWLGG